MADIPLRVTNEDYARAERFLSWNKDRYVVNADVQHHWIGEQDRFWYLRTNVVGGKEFVVIDAPTGTRSPAFDHALVAAALSQATAERIEPRQLPFSSFRYADQERAVQFHYKDRLWLCRLAAASCTGATHVMVPHESPSPDGRWAVFIKKHNLWIRETSGGAESQLSSDGEEHYSYAGSPGYSTHAVSDRRRLKPWQPQVLWSPDSRFVLTHRLEERQVKDAFLIQSVPDDGSLRPILHSYKYALPGDAHLPSWEPVMFDVQARRKIKLATAPSVCLPQTPIEKRDAWWSADSAAIYYLNRSRYSKSVILYRASPVTGEVREILRETGAVPVQTNANNIFDFPLARTLSSGEVVWYSQRDGWGHLYLYGADGRLINQITRGAWALRDVIRIDEAVRRIYFMASGRERGADPYEQYLYSIAFDGSGLRLLTPEEGDHSRPHPLLQAAAPDVLSTEAQRAAFSSSGRYFVDSYSQPNLPPIMVLRAADGRLITQLEQADISKLREGGYSAIEPFKVLAADGRTAVYGNLFRPSTFDPRHRYPVIDAIYPGPQAIRTAKRFTAAVFDSFEAQSLAELGFIVVTIDGRGTPNRSREFLEYSYGQMHRASDLEDHIAGIRELARRYPYMDLTRVGIDGASGGGFAAARAILIYQDFYKVAVAAEGNHDPLGYLAAWTESFNGPVYGRADTVVATLSSAANLKGKLLLMHGEMDDNVSPALTLKLVDALVKANKDFELLILPGANHAAFATSPYFIRRKWDFFVRHLLGTDPPTGYSIVPPP